MKMDIKKLCSGIMVLAAVLAPAIASAEETKFKVSEFTFTKPAAWETVNPSSSMRKAQFKVPGEKSKEGADVVFYQFGSGPMGGVKANVDRWLGQFEEPLDKINAKIEETTIGKTKVTFVQAQGTYKSGMPGGPTTPMPDYGLGGAIIESGDGNIFVKMTGPKALVKSSLVEFRKMVEDGLK